MLSRARAWIREFRLPFLCLAAVPLAIGSAVAYGFYPGQFSWPYFFLSLAALLSLHAGAIAFNDYFDLRADRANRERTPFTGGTGLLVDGALGPSQVLAAGAWCFALCISLGMFIVLARSPVIFLFGVAGVCLGAFYTAPPFRLAYRLLGEITWLLSFPLTALGGLFVQAPPSGPDDVLTMLPAIAASVNGSMPVALLATAGLLVLELPDYEADRNAGKVGLAVLLGKRAAIALFAALCALAIGWAVADVAFGVLSVAGLLTLSVLPAFVWVQRGLARFSEEPAKLVPYIAAGAAAIYLFGAIIVLALLM